MDAQTFDNILGALLSREPYRPFAAVLANGDRVEVSEPRSLAYRGGTAVYLTGGGIPIIFTRAEVSHFVGESKPRDGNTVT